MKGTEEVRLSMLSMEGGCCLTRTEGLWGLPEQSYGGQKIT